MDEHCGGDQLGSVSGVEALERIVASSAQEGT